MEKRYIEITVGLFMILGVVALVFLALKVSGLADYHSANNYTLMAEFDNVGGLKPRAPVTVAGVRVGEVGSVSIDKTNYRAKVTLLIDKTTNNLPTDTAASIYTQGLLGANYIGLSPGYNNSYLKNGDVIENTSPAIVLEKLIGQFLFSLKGNK